MHHDWKLIIISMLTNVQTRLGQRKFCEAMISPKSVQHRDSHLQAIGWDFELVHVPEPALQAGVVRHPAPAALEENGICRVIANNGRIQSQICFGQPAFGSPLAHLPNTFTNNLQYNRVSEDKLQHISTHNFLLKNALGLIAILSKGLELCGACARQELTCHQPGSGVG